MGAPAPMGACPSPLCEGSAHLATRSDDPPPPEKGDPQACRHPGEDHASRTEGQATVQRAAERRKRVKWLSHGRLCDPMDCM